MIARYMNCRKQYELFITSPEDTASPYTHDLNIRTSEYINQTQKIKIARVLTITGDDLFDRKVWFGVSFRLFFFCFVLFEGNRIPLVLELFVYNVI